MSIWRASFRVLAISPKVARAAREVISASENRNPYELSEHSAIRRGNEIDCDEPDFWLDDDTLVSREELGEVFFLACDACAYQYILWEAILGQSCDEGELPTSEYGDRVFAALALEEEMGDRSIGADEITAMEREDLRVVKRERQRMEAMRAWERAQEAEAQNRAIKQHG